MKIIKKKISELKLAPYNPRTISDEEMQKLKESIKKFGYIEPIIYNKRNGIVVGGNQRLKALQSIGADEVEVVEVNLSDNEEKTLNVALNKISGDWDDERLSEILKGLEEEDAELLKLTGFEDAEISGLFDEYENIEDEDSYSTNNPVNNGEEVEEEYKNISLKKYILNFKNIIVMFSGGKDSIATVLWCLENIGNNFKLVYVDTGINFPNLKEYIIAFSKKHNLQLEIIGYDNDEPYINGLKKNGYPCLFSRWCHTQLKAKPIQELEKKYKEDYDVIFVSGERKDESTKRKDIRDRGIYNKFHYAKPICDYVEEDVKSVLRKNNIKLFESYKYFNRLSCFCCPYMGENDWQILRKFYPALFCRAIEYLGIATKFNDISRSYIERNFLIISQKKDIRVAKYKELA